MISPDAFRGRAFLTLLIDDLTRYITDTPPAPGFDEVVMPGAYDFPTRERRLVEGIPVSEETWRQIVETGLKVGVALGSQPGPGEEQPAGSSQRTAPASAVVKSAEGLLDEIDHSS